MELLVLNGVKVKTALTINSTAIFMLGDEVEKITDEEAFISCLNS